MFGRFEKAVSVRSQLIVEFLQIRISTIYYHLKKIIMIHLLTVILESTIPCAGNACFEHVTYYFDNGVSETCEVWLESGERMLGILTANQNKKHNHMF